MEFDNYAGLLKKAPAALQSNVAARYRRSYIWLHGDRSKFLKCVKSGGFSGWCYQSASLSALMLDDDAVVQHGQVDLPTIHNGDHTYIEAKGYGHGWVNIEHKGKKYIFDPALSMLADADEYSEKFNARITREVPAEKIKRFIIDARLGNPLKEYGDRSEYDGEICGIKTDENSVARCKNRNELPGPYFYVEAGAKEGLLVGAMNVHIDLSKKQEIKGFEAALYLSC